MKKNVKKYSQSIIISVLSLLMLIDYAVIKEWSTENNILVIGWGILLLLAISNIVSERKKPIVLHAPKAELEITNKSGVLSLTKKQSEDILHKVYHALQDQECGGVVNITLDVKIKKPKPPKAK